MNLVILNSIVCVHGEPNSVEIACHQMYDSFRAMNPDKKAIYTTGELFCDRVVEGMLKGDPFLGISHYQEGDLLVIENIEQIVGRKKAVFYFCQLLDMMKKNEKGVILGITDTNKVINFEPDMWRKITRYMLINV